MKIFFNFGREKPACGKGFSLPNKFVNYLKALRYYGTKTLRNVFQLLSHSTIKQNLFTVHRSQFTKAAFTLAETLIVIGIIGVVAALTLPNLNHATGDKEKVTRVKKIYSALTDAFDRAQAVYGDFDTWYTDLSNSEVFFFSGSNHANANERFAKRVTEFMKVSKDCGFDEGCFSDIDKIGYDGNIARDNLLSSLQNCDAYMVTLFDGTSLAFFMPGDFVIEVDIDGPNKGKNQNGNDIFDFYILNYSSICSNQLLTTDDCSINYYEPSYSYSASAWVIENENLDYLKCFDELNWETQTSCK